MLNNTGSCLVARGLRVRPAETRIAYSPPSQPTVSEQRRADPSPPPTIGAKVAQQSSQPNPIGKNLIDAASDQSCPTPFQKGPGECALAHSIGSGDVSVNARTIGLGRPLACRWPAHTPQPWIDASSRSGSAGGCCKMIANHAQVLFTSRTTLCPPTGFMR